MSKKCGATHKDVWGEALTCTRNKNHHGNHTQAILLPYLGKQWYWKSNHWYNYERYCGKTIGGYTEFRCERKPGHKTWHKCFISHVKQYITWKVLP